MDVFSLPILLLFPLLGALAGFLAGLLGMGGGIILVPLFLWAFRIGGIAPEVVVHLAFGTSLAIIIPTALTSTLAHRKHGNVDWNQVGPLALGGVAGAFAGSTLAAQLPGLWLKGCFGLMLGVIGARMFFRDSYLPPERSTPVPLAQLLIVGGVAGAFSAFFGVGGGIVGVPLMVIGLELPAHQAVGNSSALIVVSALAGALSYMLHGWNVAGLPAYSLGYVNVLVVGVVAPFSMGFARFGVKIAGRVSHERLVRIFAVVLLLIGARMLLVTFL
jgi:uncharacterized protein